MRIDLAFSLDSTYDIPNTEIEDSVDWILKIEEEFPGFLGEQLGLYQRVKAGRFSVDDYVALHRAEVTIKARMMEFVSTEVFNENYPEEDLMENLERLSTAVTAAIDIEKVFKGEKGPLRYWADEKTTKLFNMLTKCNSKKPQDGSALGLY